MIPFLPLHILNLANVADPRRVKYVGQVPDVPRPGHDLCDEAVPRLLPKVEPHVVHLQLAESGRRLPVQLFRPEHLVPAIKVGNNGDDTAAAICLKNWQICSISDSDAAASSVVPFVGLGIGNPAEQEAQRGREPHLVQRPSALRRRMTPIDSVFG